MMCQYEQVSCANLITFLRIMILLKLTTSMDVVRFYLIIFVLGAPLVGYTFHGLITRFADKLSKFICHIIKY